MRSTETPQVPRRETDWQQQVTRRAPTRRGVPRRRAARASPRSSTEQDARVRDARAMLRRAEMQQDAQARDERETQQQAEMQQDARVQVEQLAQVRCRVESRLRLRLRSARGARADAAEDPQDAQLLVAPHNEDNEARPLRNAVRSTGRGHSASIASREAWRRILPSKPREIRSFLVETSKKCARSRARRLRSVATRHALRSPRLHRRSSGDAPRARTTR